MKKMCLLVVGLLSMQCNKLPLGDDEFDLRGNFDAREIVLRCENTLTEFNKHIKLGRATNLVVGKNSDYEARILLKFTFPDSSYQGLDGIKLILKRNTDFHRDTIRVGVYLLDEEFYEYNASWYQRTDIEYWDSAGGDYVYDSLRSIVLTSDSVVVSFNYVQLEDIKNADGLILVPQEDGFVNFYARESGYSPQFILEKNDEVTSIPIAADCYIVTGPEPISTESWIGAGFPYRNYARFVVDSTLADKKALFADLSFRIEEHFAMRDSVEIGIKELLEPLDDFNTPIGPLVSLDRFSVTDSMFSLDLVAHIQRVIEHPDSNFGFFIVISPENYEISAFKIVHGSHTLTVGYISPPEGRF